MADKKDTVVTPKTSVKTFSFNKEEQDFLQPIQALYNQHQFLLNAIKAQMDAYVVTNVAKRIGADPNGSNIEYNVMTGNIVVSPQIVAATAMPTPNAPVKGN